MLTPEQTRYNCPLTPEVAVTLRDALAEAKEQCILGDRGTAFSPLEQLLIRNSESPRLTRNELSACEFALVFRLGLGAAVRNDDHMEATWRALTMIRSVIEKTA